MTSTQQIKVEAIAPFSIGGCGYGNSYRYAVTTDGIRTLASCERDVAYGFVCAGLPVPAEFEGPYDSCGNKK
jgi:hypothetical protein